VAALQAKLETAEQATRIAQQEAAHQAEEAARQAERAEAAQQTKEKLLEEHGSMSRSVRLPYKIDLRGKKTSMTGTVCLAVIRA
jgi:hypothetical protein